MIIPFVSISYSLYFLHYLRVFFSFYYKLFLFLSPSSSAFPLYHSLFITRFPLLTPLILFSLRQPLGLNPGCKPPWNSHLIINSHYDERPLPFNFCAQRSLSLDHKSWGHRFEAYFIHGIIKWHYAIEAMLIAHYGQKHINVVYVFFQSDIDWLAHSFIYSAWHVYTCIHFTHW